MSKKPKQSRHRVPTITMTSDEVTDDYQAEVDASMERLRRRYDKAQKALLAAEAKAERARIHAEELAAKQAESERIAQNRELEERRLSDRITQIKLAAQESRVAEGKARLEQQRQAAVAERNRQTELRKAEQKAIRDRNAQIALHRNRFRSLESDVHERRREVREIEMLMMPGNYAGRSHRGTGAVHNSGRRS